MEELMALIVKTILHKKDLIDAKELVFVRKYLGFSRKQLSNLLKYSYEHLAKVEKENTGYKVSRQLDGSLRAMLLMKLQCPEYEYLDKIETDKLQKLNRLFIHPTKSGWEVDEAA